MENLQSIDGQFEFAAAALVELQGAKSADEKTKLDTVIAILEAMLTRAHNDSDLYGQLQSAENER